MGLGEGFILDMRVGLGMYFFRCGVATVVVYCFLPEVLFKVVVKKKNCDSTKRARIFRLLLDLVY